jgi:hypothetical protein
MDKSRLPQLADLGLYKPKVQNKKLEITMTIERAV